MKAYKMGLVALGAAAISVVFPYAKSQIRNLTAPHHVGDSCKVPERSEYTRQDQIAYGDFLQIRTDAKGRVAAIGSKSVPFHAYWIATGADPEQIAMYQQDALGHAITITAGVEVEANMYVKAKWNLDFEMRKAEHDAYHKQP